MVVAMKFALLLLLLLLLLLPAGIIFHVSRQKIGGGGAGGARGGIGGRGGGRKVAAYGQTVGQAQDQKGMCARVLSFAALVRTTVKLRC